jgi:four helix bundle protein
MSYEEWAAQVPQEITGDPLWRPELYRLGLYAADVAWNDAMILSQTKLTRELADQLYRAVCSISTNIFEGYSRSTGRDRARFLEYSMGSAREARDWYYKSRLVLANDVTTARVALLTRIIKMLIVLTFKQRQIGIREEPSSYAPDVWPEIPEAESETSAP